jgi:hypothetical protein
LSVAVKIKAVNEKVMLSMKSKKIQAIVPERGRLARMSARARKKRRD